MKSSSRAFPRGGRGEPKPLRTKGSSLSQPFRYANRVRTILRFSPRRGFCARPAKLLPLIRAVSTRDTPVRTEPSFPILVPLLFSFPPFTVSRLFPLSSSIAELFPPIGNNGADREYCFREGISGVPEIHRIRIRRELVACERIRCEKSRPVCVMKSLTDRAARAKGLTHNGTDSLQE